MSSTEVAGAKALLSSTEVACAKARVFALPVGYPRVPSGCVFANLTLCALSPVVAINDD